jgi:hypothetical protein
MRFYSSQFIEKILTVCYNSDRNTPKENRHGIYPGESPRRWGKDFD